MSAGAFMPIICRSWSTMSAMEGLLLPLALAPLPPAPLPLAAVLPGLAAPALAPSALAPSPLGGSTALPPALAWCGEFPFGVELTRVVGLRPRATVPKTVKRLLPGSCWAELEAGRAASRLVLLVPAPLPEVDIATTAWVCARFSFVKPCSSRKCGAANES